MNGKASKYKNWVILGLVCITILSITFSPVMSNQNKESVSWTGYFTINGKNYSGGWKAVFGRLEQFPSSIYRLLWGSIIVIFLGTMLQISNKDNIIGYVNRQRKRTGIITGAQISFGSILGLSCILLVIVMKEQFLEFKPTFNFTSGFYIISAAFTINLAFGLQTLISSARKKRHKIQENMLLLDETKKITQNDYSFFTDNLQRNTSDIRKLFGSIFIAAFYVNIPYAFFLIFIQFSSKFYWFNDFTFFQFYIISYLVVFCFVVFIQLHEFYKNKKIISIIKENYKRIIITSFLCMLVLGAAVWIVYVYTHSGYYYLEEFRLIFFDKIYDSSVLLKTFGYLIYLIYLALSWLVFITPGIIALSLIILSGILFRLLLKNRFASLLASLGTSALFNILLFSVLPRLKVKSAEYVTHFQLDFPKWVFAILLVGELVILPIICLMKPRKIKPINLLKWKNELIKLNVIKKKIKLKLPKRKKHIMLKLQISQLKDYLKRKLGLERSYIYLEQYKITKQTVTLVEFLINNQEYVSFEWIKILSGLNNKQLIFIVEDILGLSIVKDMIINEEAWH